MGAGTCGLGAGAKETLAAIHKYLDDHEIKADVVMVGCIGLCSLEPIVEVQLPGRARVCYKQITADKVARSARCGVVRRRRPTDLFWASIATMRCEPWPDVPFLDEHPFFAPQTRWVLANCGIIDPSQIDEYIARGGYKALVEMLRGTTPEAVCDIVEQSGLRGRGGGGFPTGKKWKFARAVCPAIRNISSATPTKATPARSWTGPLSKAIRIGWSRAWPSPPTASARRRHTSTFGPSTRWPSSD